MSLELAMRLTEILLGLAFIQQSAEHLYRGERNERILFGVRLILSIALMTGVWAPLVCIGLLGTSCAMLVRYQGPYNGGSDRMGHLILFCLSLAELAPNETLQSLALGYLALQVTLSYFISGWVKVVEPAWRNGEALRDVFDFSAYPVSETMRGWAQRPRLLGLMSWAVIGFELLFPFTLLYAPTLYAGLLVAFVFHMANTALFGLNRFVWIWIAAYPAILWFQGRFIEGVF